MVYGKQEENAPQDGGRGEGEAELDIPAEDGSPVTSDALEAKKREFRKLIGGEYKDLYQQEVSGRWTSGSGKTGAWRQSWGNTSP